MLKLKSPLVTPVLLLSALALAPLAAQGMGSSKPTKPVPVELDPSEPPFCDYAGLQKHQVSVDSSGLDREMAYQIGALRLVGVAVGDSDNEALKTLARKTSPALGSAQKYCTWYFNDGDDDAKRQFTWRNVERPDSDPRKAAREYSEVLSSIFDQDSVSFLSCAQREGYVAMGCDGQKHRGPSVFAMFLSYAGCTPEHSVLIVNALWGENGIKPESRRAVAQVAYDLGKSHPEQRRKLQELMGFIAP